MSHTIENANRQERSDYAKALQAIIREQERKIEEANQFITALKRRLQDLGDEV